MKPLFILLTVVSSFFAKTSLATETTNEVTHAALRSFKKTFTNATEVSWSHVNEDLYRADFALNGQYASAFYDDKGELIATTRNVPSSQLPLLLQAELKTEYQDYWITDLFELTNGEGTQYYVTLENADEKLVLKAQPSKSWKTFQKGRKA